MKKYLLLSCAFYFMLSFPVARAVEIDPMRLEHSLEAGKTYSGSFRLSNTSDFAVKILASTGTYRYIFSENSIPPQGGKKTLPSCQGWLQFEKTKVNLTPGEFTDAKFLIKVPRDAAGEYLCAVIFDENRSLKENAPKDNEGSVRIQLTPRFSIPIYISIKNTEKTKAEITDLRLTSGSKKGEIIINVTLKNTGNTHIRPFGTLIIFNQNGEVVKNLPIGKSLPVFPGYQETIPVLCRNLPTGKFSAVATVEIAKDNIIQKKTAFGIGKTSVVE